MADVLRTPDEVGQDDLGQLTESVRLDRTAEDLLFQVLVDWGLELTLPIEDDHIDGHDVYTVDDGAVTACFAPKITEGVLTTIAQRQPLRAVFRDDAFLDDSARINAEQIFTEASPATDIRTI